MQETEMEYRNTVSFLTILFIEHIEVFFLLRKWISKSHILALNPEEYKS